MLTAYLLKKGKTLEVDLTRAQMFQALSEKEALLWVDLENPTEFESDTLVEIFNFHELAVEDCLTDYSVPKVDDYESYLFVVTHGLYLKRNEEEKTDRLATIELDIFVGQNYVVTFHNEPMKSISFIRDAVRRKPPYYMGQGSDFLFHSILDNLVDNVEPILSFYDEKIDMLEEEVCNHPDYDFLSIVVQMKKDVFTLRRTIAPQRDIVNFITRHPTPLIKKKHVLYFRDIYDHLVRVHGIAEGFHESIPSLLQIYFSHSSHRLNEIMKRMTVLATLSMPAIMIASIYGMNFRYMPELQWHYGYFISLGVMALTSIGMLIWMKHKKWI